MFVVNIIVCALEGSKPVWTNIKFCNCNTISTEYFRLYNNVITSGALNEMQSVLDRYSRFKMLLMLTCQVKYTNKSTR